MIWWLLGCAPVPPPTCEIEEGLPSFPGAEGFGTTTPGGRGGAVLAVTSLDDHGPGTLREAVETAGPRTIVFRTGGTIALERQLEIHEPFLTVAGQTAPGGGVQIRGAGVVVFTHDVVLRHLRIRPGPAPSAPEAEVNDAIAILGDVEGRDAGHHIVLDHLSVAWSEDEAISVWDEAHDVTLSWSIVAEALDRSGHPKGGHSAGVLAGAGSSCVSLHHLVHAHDGFRNPLLSGGGLHDVVNGLFYDFGDLAAEVHPVTAPTRANFVGNQWVRGPSTTWEGPAIWVGVPASAVHWPSESWHLMGGYGTAELFLEDNAFDGDLTGRTDGEPLDPEQRSPIRFETAPVTAFPASELWDRLLPEAGAAPRDAVDARIVQEIRDGTGGIIDDPSAVGGWPVLEPGVAPVDTDGDGLPDDWEIDRGLDPATPDSDGDDDGDGWTNLEEWLAELALELSSDEPR